APATVLVFLATAAGAGAVASVVTSRHALLRRRSTGISAHREDLTSFAPLDSRSVEHVRAGAGPPGTSATSQLPRGVQCRLHLGRGQVGQTIEGTGDRGDALPRDVRVDHGRFEALVAEQLLHRADVHAPFEQVRREAVALMPISA